MRGARLAMLLTLPLWCCECDPEDNSDSVERGGVFWATPDSVVVPVDAEQEIEVHTDLAALDPDESTTVVLEVSYDATIIAPPGTSGAVLGGDTTYRVLPKLGSTLERFELTWLVMAAREKRTTIWRCERAGSTTIFIGGRLVVDNTAASMLNQMDMMLETVDVTCGSPPPDAGTTDAGDAGTTDVGNAIDHDAGTPDGGVSAFAAETIAKTGDRIVGSTETIGEIMLHGIDDSGAVTLVNRGMGPAELLRVDGGGLRLAVTEAELQRVLGAYQFRNFEGLIVSRNGDVALTISTDVTRCLLNERGGTLTKLLCNGDTVPVAGAMGPVDRVTLVAANDGAQVVTFRAVLSNGGQRDGNVHWVHHRAGTFTTIIRDFDPQPDTPNSTALVERVANVSLGPNDEVAFTTRTFEADHNHVRWTPAEGLRSRVHVNVRDQVGSITIPADTVLQYPFGVSPLDGVTTRAGFHGFMVNFIDGNGNGLPLSGLETDGLLFRNLRLEQEIADTGRRVAWFNNLPMLHYQLIDDCDADDCTKVFAARLDSDEVSIWRQDKSNTGDNATPVALLTLASQLPTFANDVDIEAIGGILVSDVGSVATIARLVGPGIRAMPEGELAANNHVVVGINSRGETAVLLQTGAMIDLGSGPTPIDRIELHNNALGVPFTDLDFLGRNTRDTHVAHGSGADGHHTSFNANGCGQLVVRLATSRSRSANALQRITVPGACR